MSKPDLLNLLDRWQPQRILVAGDYMLDRYAFGHADRLSPDAPVPVLHVQRTDDRPGGAANVCRDLVALRCEALALGVVGDDETGRALKHAMNQGGIDTTALLAAPGRPTTVKHNLVGLAQHRHPQKMFRLDTEDRTPIDDALVAQLLRLVDEALQHGCDVVCLEDYNKGVCTEAFCQGVIERAKQHGVPVMVDPAAVHDYAKYRGADAITPNRTEAKLATNLDEPAAMAKTLQNKHDLKHIVLTLDKSGALLRDPRGTETTVPTRARAVYDVTGAGDMVLAMLAAAVANGAAWVDAVHLANLAAGLEVEKAGVVPIPLDDILLEVLREYHNELGKQRTVEQLVPELRAHRAQGKSIAFTNGCFDILHAGHVAFLRAARATGDVLVVGLNSDDSIRRIKAEKNGPPRPVNQEADRVMVLSELQSIDYVVVFGDDTPLSLIEAVQPDVLVKGADYTRETVVGHELVEARGGRVELIGLVEGRSTTNILRKLDTPA